MLDSLGRNTELKIRQKHSKCPFFAIFIYPQFRRFIKIYHVKVESSIFYL